MRLKGIGLGVALALGLLAAPLAAEAQQTGRVARIGFLGTTAINQLTAFVHEVRALQRGGLLDFGAAAELTASARDIIDQV